MKKYIKPEMEVIKLRVEERIAVVCSGEQFISENDMTDLECFVALPGDNLGECYDLTDCS